MHKMFIVISFSFFISSCATVFTGTSQKLEFHSQPGGAHVYINATYMGDTPLRIKLKSNETYHIEFKKEGYETQVRHLSNHIQTGWLVLDILTGFFPIIVDAVTGAWYSLDQENVTALLSKQQIKEIRPDKIKTDKQKFIENTAKDKNQERSLKLYNIQKEIEKAENKRKWGWAITVPPLAFTVPFTLWAIGDGALEDAPGGVVLIALPAVITSYIGIKMIVDANNTIKELEEERMKNY